MKMKKNVMLCFLALSIISFAPIFLSWIYFLNNNLFKDVDVISNILLLYNNFDQFIWRSFAAFTFDLLTFIETKKVISRMYLLFQFLFNLVLFYFLTSD